MARLAAENRIFTESHNLEDMRPCQQANTFHAFHGSQRTSKYKNAK